ncbi:hypothetical protein [Pseudoxanthomonas sp. PXM01]|uniref:hypothetical protein n=1 Tax=Pseudoxanthomonas sp. PXM01 TaxID=2769295 RepID=UPI0017805E81|nr:hypothetical protein [Pseudoxanthomonas sp. PXM01]MBD9470811.1 hypothetical protein [Pseudoxanthomonas sp. PXM01]
MRRFLVVLLCLLLLACERRPPVVNDAPSDAVHVTILTTGLPPEGKVSAIAHYLVEDDRCLPVDYSKAIGGTKPEIALQHGIAVERVGDGSFVSTAYGDHYAPTVVRRGYSACIWRLQSISVGFDVRNVSRVSFLKENDIDSGAAKHEVCRFRDPVPAFCRAEPEDEPLHSGVRIVIQANRNPPGRPSERGAVGRQPGTRHAFPALSFPILPTDIRDRLCRPVFALLPSCCSD